MPKSPQLTVHSLTIPDAPKKTGGARKGERLDGVSIDKAANGYVLRTRYVSDAPAKNSYPGPYREPEQRVFESVETLLAHLVTVLK